MRRPLLSLGLGAVGLAALLLVVLALSRPASALPPAGTDTFGVNAMASIESRLGAEDITFTGTVTIERDAPHNDGGDEVQDLHITSMTLNGLSATGFVTITQSINMASDGELRSSGPGEFPADSFFDVFIEAEIPAAGFRTEPPFFVHNGQPLHLVPEEGSIDAWPPDGVKYVLDTSELPTPTPYPFFPPDSPSCADGVWLLPELPAVICLHDLSLTLGPPPTPTPTSTPCDGTCPQPPTNTPTNTRTPRPTNTPTPTPTSFGPENPTFSVGPGGPSGFHPAALLALDAGGPVTVGGNDNFADAYQVPFLPFAGVQSTINFTTEPNEQLNPNGCITVTPNIKGATAWYRFVAPSSGIMTLDTEGSNVDTVLAIYTGNNLATLTSIGCNDDGPGAGLSSIVSAAVSAGTTYHVQAGGFDGDTGTLNLNLQLPGGAGSAGGGSGAVVALTCSQLGLSSDGCDSGADGDQDDIDALSFGSDSILDSNPIAFSVGPGSQGVEGSGVAGQAACSPPQPQADEFVSTRNGTNSLLLDGDGQGGGCPPAFGLGLIETPESDNLDGLDGHPPGFVDPERDGQLDNPVFFSLAPGSPSLAPGNFSPADILWTIGFSPGLYASAQQLGLQAGDDIDGLCLVDVGKEQARYNAAEDTVMFSLAEGSPTLNTLNLSPGAVLMHGPWVRYQASEIGLRPVDELDAMKCFQTSGAQSVKVPVGDSQEGPVGFWYCDPTYSGEYCESKISVGDTVVWNWVGTAPHTVTACGEDCDDPTDSPLFDSGIHTNGGTFQQTFNAPGVYPYFCEVHPFLQRGRIIVLGDGPPPTVTPTGPTPTRTPAGQAGDANKDGNVNAIDATLVLQHSAGMLSNINSRADANQDGDISSLDAALILQYVAGLLNQLPP